MAYKKIQGEKVYCPECGKEPILLCDEINKPAFNICFDCRRISEIAVGVVEFMADDDETEAGE